MPMYSTGARGWTPVAHADAAATLASSSYHALRTTTASTLRILEVFIGGEASSSTVNRMAYRRLSTNASTPTNVAPSKLNPLSAAAVSQGYVAASTGPTIASAPTDILNLAFNAFGGIIRWVAAPNEEIWQTAGTAPNGEAVLDSISGTGVVSTHMIFEEM